MRKRSDSDMIWIVKLIIQSLTKGWGIQIEMVKNEYYINPNSLFLWKRSVSKLDTAKRCSNNSLWGFYVPISIAV